MPSVARRSPTSQRVSRAFRAAILPVSVLAAAASAPGIAAAEPAGVARAPEPALPAWASEYARGHWSAAIELLETIPESARTAWHWLHLARAREKRGQLVEAFAAHERLREVANDAPRAPGMKDIAQKASLESAAIAERIPWAEVAIALPLPSGALVFVDQQWLEPTRMRSPYPVNPGWHTFLVESNGSILAARRVHFEEGQNRLVPLTPVSAGSAPPPAEAAATLTRPRAPGAADASPVKAAARSHELTWRTADSRLDQAPSHQNQYAGLRTAAYVSLGIGGISTLIGTGLAISALQARDRSDPAPVPCFSGGCSATSADEGWQSQASAAALSYTVGLIGLVTGGVLWLAHREYTTAQPTLKIAQVELEPRVKANGAVLHGRF